MTNENVFRFTTLLLMLSAFSISGYFRRKAEQGGKSGDVDFSQEKRWVYRLRVGGALLGYGGMLLYLIFPPSMKWAQLELTDSLRWTGAGLMLFMLPLLYWMFSSLGNNVTPTVSIREEHEMVVRGPYRYIRHPLYTFGFLNMIGMSLLIANSFVFLALLGVMFAIVERADREEENLVEKFGQSYKEYQLRTGRFLPRIGEAAQPERPC